MLLYRHDWSCSLLAVAFSIAQLTTKCSASSRNQTDDGSVFINEIFQLYGKRNATFITQAKFASMLHQLTLGNVYVEKLDKFCLYKGVHNGYREEPSKTDGVVNSQGLHGGEKLVRERRSGDHSKKDKHIEDPKHNEHLQNHLKHVSSLSAIFSFTICSLLSVTITYYRCLEKFTFTVLRISLSGQLVNYLLRTIC